MTVSHHLDDATLVRYASGDLDEAFCVVAAAHIAMCETCRNAARAAEEVGGRLLQDAGEEAMSAFAFERLMEHVEKSEHAVEQKTDRRRADVLEGDVPLPLRRYVGSSLADIPWRVVAPGVRKHAIELATSGSSSLFMLNIAPGKTMPEHGHGGAEATLILSGAYRDDMGVFRAGDIADLDEHVEHQPRVEPGAPCICVIAIEAPTRFKGLFSRLMQPFVRI